jgi:hypothetical protein
VHCISFTTEVPFFNFKGNDFKEAKNSYCGIFSKMMKYSKFEKYKFLAAKRLSLHSFNY